MNPALVTLREERSGRDVRRLWASVTAAGDLLIEGQDLGPGVEAFWGEGQSEYEWCLTVRAANLPALLKALGGQPGDSVLQLLSARFTEDEQCASPRFLQQHDVKHEFWNRAGD
jgi:hypothetical protein